jgi:L-alanine-DL-glutamate epimerase-like enolase superfamily enzyme
MSNDEWEGLLRIERVEVFVTDLPTRLERLSSSGRYDTGATGVPMGKPVLVRVFAGGVVGNGQIRPIAPSHFLPDTGASMVAAIRDVYAPRMIGRPVSDIAAMIAAFDLSLPGNVQARAAVDHALHDAMGKATGLPVHRLLGGRCYERIPLEWSVSLAEQPDTMVAESRRAVEAFGISTLCLKAGHPAGWRQDVANFAAVRGALGENVTIGIDPNTGWSVSEARQALAALIHHRLDYLEQPIARGNIAGLAAIRADARGVPIMADESLMSLDDAFKLAAAQAVDVFCIKLYKVGGFRAAMKIAAIAEAADIRVNVGGLAAFSQLEAAAGINFHAAIPPRQVMPAGEFLFGLGVVGPDPLVPDPTYRIEDGHVSPSELPGLGVTIDEAALERLTLVREVVT